MVELNRPPGQRSLLNFGVRRVDEKQPPPEVDQAEVKRDEEAKRHARKQHEQDAAAAAAAAKRPVGRPKGSGKKPAPAAVPGPAAVAPLLWPAASSSAQAGGKLPPLPMRGSRAGRGRGQAQQPGRAGPAGVK
jgi:hypothetical protein